MRELSGAHLANLHTFLVAARHLSFARAADELCLTASAVSHRIARLEAELALKLFQRLPRQVLLTEDGERIYRSMQQAMDTLNEALQARSDEQVAGQLTFHVRPSVAQCWLVPKLADFSARYPDIQLDVRVGNERIDYRTRQVDLLLCFSDGDHPGLVSTRLMAERIAPVCSAHYARQQGLSNRPDALRGSTLLHDVAAWDNAAFDAEWQLWRRAAGWPEVQAARFLTFDRSDLCSLAAVHHAGIAMGREQLVREQLADGQLVLPFGDFLTVGKHGYYLVHPAHAPMPRRLQVLIEWLLSMAAR